MENNDFINRLRLTPETLLPSAPPWIKTASYAISAVIIIISTIPLYGF